MRESQQTCWKRSDHRRPTFKLQHVSDPIKGADVSGASTSSSSLLSALIWPADCWEDHAAEQQLSAAPDGVWPFAKRESRWFLMEIGSPDKRFNWRMLKLFLCECLVISQSFGVAEGGRVEDLRDMARAAGEPFPDFTPPEGETPDQVRNLLVIQRLATRWQQTAISSLSKHVFTAGGC